LNLPALGLLAALCASAPGAPPAPEGFVAADTPEALPEPLDAALARIQAAPLAAHIAYLADPNRQGRGLGTRGLEATARYLTGHLVKAGLAPLGPTYVQAVPLRRISALGGEVTLTLPGREAILWRHGRTGLLPELEPQTLAAPVVFAGYGIQEPALAHDDYKGLEVLGKVVLLVGGLPPGPQWRTPELMARYGSVKPQERYAARVEALDRLGALAVVALEEGEGEPFAAKPSEPFFRPAKDVPSTEEPPLARVCASRELLRALGVTPGTLAGATAALRTTGEVGEASSRNILAVLPGRDPQVKGEAVVLGAHMDHLGMAGGVLHPGADDNGSGVAALLEIARAFAASKARPRRTVIFAFWTGEEDGKFGSGHYVRHPRWPLARTAAYLNLDMIGHPWLPEEIRKLVLEADPVQGPAFLARVEPAAFAEPGFARWAPDLGPVLARAGRGTGMALHLDPGDGINGGSDYRDFARAKVPWVRFFGNYFPEYHEAGDKPENLDPAQVRRMARLAMATAWLLADR